MYQPDQPKIHPIGRVEDETSTLAGNFSAAALHPLEKTAGELGLQRKDEANIHCLADFAIYPLGTTSSFQKYIDEVEKVLKRCGRSTPTTFNRRLFRGDVRARFLCILALRQILHAFSSAVIVGVDYKIHPQCTTMEGDMGTIMYALKACHEILRDMGCPHVSSR